MLADKGVGQITIRTDAVPVAFVAVESGSDQFRIAFAKQNGPIRIALYSDPSEFHHIGVTEHFAPILKTRVVSSNGVHSSASGRERQ